MNLPPTLRAGLARNGLRAGRGAAFGLALLLLSACGGEDRVLRYDELAPVPHAGPAARAEAPSAGGGASDAARAASSVPASDAGGSSAASSTAPPGPELAGTPCADRVRWGWQLRDGDELRLDADLGEEPRLVVAYCRPRGGRGELRVRVADPDRDAAPLLEERREVAGAPGWQRWEVDLAPLAGERAAVALEVELPPDARVVVSDAYVRHRSGPATGWAGPAVWVEAEDGREALAAPGATAPESTTAAGVTAGAGRQILLISVDTLRWEALVAEVQGRPVMPELVGLAAEGEVFSPHYAGASWTKPSHATLLTGQPLSVHGADGEEGSLDPAVPTLALRLGEAGLATGAVVHDCVWLNPKFGFHRGFDRYRSIKGGMAPAARAAVNWIAAHRDRPFFFFLHAFDAHSDFDRLPYEATSVSTATVEDVFGVSGYGCRQGECASGLLAAINRREVAPLPGEDLILRHLYAAGLQELDVELGRLFRDLRELGIWDDLTVVLTSDHGEMLLEHGDTLHGLTWEPVLRVPLVVKWPGGERAGRRVEIPTGSVDVAPTLLALAGADDGGLPGVDLRRPRRDRALFSGSFSWWTVVDDGWKGLFFTDGGERLYHLAEDPGEERELSASRPEEVARLRARLDEMLDWSEATRQRLAAGATEAESELTREERERLRALGYLQ